MTHWDDSESWYDACVGEKGHYYHESMVLDGALRLLHLKPKDSLLDLGCGQGVFQRRLPKNIDYVGIDYSKALIADAKKRSPAHFLVADVCKPLPLEEKQFDAACFILSLQNMESPDLAIKNASSHLKPGGKLLLILNHPCFRIPRQSHWGVDEKSKLQYRRLNGYMSPMKIPIQTNPGKGKESATTYSFHFPISSYLGWLNQNNMATLTLEEWCSDKKSIGAKAKMEDRARKEFPLFLAILAEKKHTEIQS